uniref:Uncharacterized protein n=1 Tax=Schistocephalus solidus TaxID=70667 RepID=A0A0X3PJ08_SCHSO
MPGLTVPYSSCLCCWRCFSSSFDFTLQIWPFTSGSPCRDIYAEVLTKQQPTRPRVALAPFVGGQREDSMAACRITAPKPLDAEDLVNQAKINHLFDQLCALPTLKRR